MILFTGIFQPEFILFLTTILLILNMIFVKKIKIPLGFILFFFLVFFHLILSGLCGYTDFIKGTTQIISIIIFLITYVNIYDKNDYTYIIEIYEKVVLFICLLGILQEIAYFAEISWIYSFFGLINPSYSNYGNFTLLRLTSIYLEPTQFMLVTIVCFYFLLDKIFLRKNKSSFDFLVFVLLTICYIFTASMNTYFAMILSIFFIVIRKKNIFLKIFTLLLTSLIIVFFLNIGVISL